MNVHRGAHDDLHGDVVTGGSYRHMHRAVTHTHTFYIEEHHPRWLGT
jgi:hypothetical protein